MIACMIAIHQQKCLIHLIHSSLCPMFQTSAFSRVPVVVEPRFLVRREAAGLEDLLHRSQGVLEEVCIELLEARTRQGL